MFENLTCGNQACVKMLLVRQYANLGCGNQACQAIEHRTSNISFLQSTVSQLQFLKPGERTQRIAG